MEEKYILAIDQGTTSTRAVLFDHDKHVVKLSQKEGQIFYPHPGWVEQNPISVWLDTASVIADLFTATDIDPSSVAAIGISNQRETAILWDKDTGLPVYNAIVWQSRQSDQICDEWKERGLEQMVRDKTGLRIDPYFSASKIAWILEHVSGVRKKAEEGKILFGTMDTWLVWRLSGKKVHITDVSNASRTLLMNIYTMEWDQELLDAFNIPRKILPKIEPTSKEYCRTSPYSFFGQEVPICSVVGDQQAALFGQGCFDKGEAKNTYGTGGFLLMNTGSRPVRSKNGLLSTIAWKIDEEVCYALEGSIFVSGSLIKWMRDKLHLFADTAMTEEMAVRAKSTNGVYIVPAFVGLGAPYWDDKARASIVGLTLGTNRDQLVRAALESMAFQSRDVIEAMEKDSGVSIEILKVDGGAVRNNFLMQFQADLLGVDVERFQFGELTAMGAAFLAGLACGFWRWDELKMKAEQIFYPNRSREVMNRVYENWKKAVQTTREFKPYYEDI